MQQIISPFRNFGVITLNTDKMFNLFERSTDTKITDLVQELLLTMKEDDMKKMLDELELQKGLAKAKAMKGSVKKNSLTMQDFVEVVRKIRKKNGWNIT